MRSRRFVAALVMACVAIPVGSAVPGSAAGRPLSWSGHDWWVIEKTSPSGAGPNYWSSSSRNVWVDAQGELHLRITRRGGKWWAAEIVGLRPLGYGVYRWKLGSAVHNFDPNVVLGLFTYGDDAAYAHREIDIEFARWGSTQTSLRGQYVIQPHNKIGNRFRFEVPSVTRSAYSYSWTPTSVGFASEWDPFDAEMAPQTWAYSGTVPDSLDETPRINLWLFNGLAPVNKKEVEVVIESFTFSPLSA